jgi:hypothetical protein
VDFIFFLIDGIFVVLIFGRRAERLCYNSLCISSRKGQSVMVLTAADTVQTVRELRLTELFELQVRMEFAYMQ